MINKYLTKDMFEVLNELDVSHSGELVCERGSWWIDDKVIEKQEAIKDLYLMRLVNMIDFTKNQQTYKITQDGLGCLESPSYTPKLISM